MLGSGGVGRVATSTTGLSLASLRLAPALPLKIKEYYQLIYSKERMRIFTRYGILGNLFEVVTILSSFPG
jgi:hypothetical protein